VLVIEAKACRRRTPAEPCSGRTAPGPRWAPRAGSGLAGAGLGRAWWVAACETTAAGEGNEGARADFGRWAAEKRRWAAGRGCWAAS
jgi:hypothetical protein